MTPRKGKKFRRVEVVEDLRLTHPHAAGIDVHAAVHFVAVPAEDVPKGFINPDAKLPAGVRKFATNTADLEAIAAWLKDCGVKTIAMESTGVYWIPLFELLASLGFEVILVDRVRPSMRRVGPRAMCWIANGSSGCTATVC